MQRTVLAITVLTITLGGVARAGAGADTNAAFDKAMTPILDAYLTIQTALAADKLDRVADAATTIDRLAKKLDVSKLSGDYAVRYQGLPQKLSQAATALARQTTIAAVREQLKELSKPMALWGTLSKPAGISVAFCSMAPGSWLQRAGELRNPYYGAAMLTCGEVVGGVGAVTQ